MKRRLLKLALFLALGAVVNIAVAWISAITINVYGGSQPLTEASVSQGVWTRATLIECFTATSIVVERVRVAGPAVRVQEPPDGQPERLIPSWSGLAARRPGLLDSVDGFRETRSAEARGWPVRSMCWQHAMSSNDSGVQPKQGAWITPIKSWTWTDGIFLTFYPRIIPLRPLWPGFAINTLFYAAALWLLFAAPFALRRWRRRRRGLCMKCAYDLRGIDSPQCPECGTRRSIETKPQMNADQRG